MSVELNYLVWSAVLAVLYIGVQSLTYRLQYGLIFSAGPRDEAPPHNRMTGRADRALRNFLETYGVFIALAVATELGGRSDALTQWGTLVYFWARVIYLPLYLTGIPFIRSLVWTISAVGLALMFLGAAF